METAKIFINGRSQAVRLPKAYRFEGNEVYIKKIPGGVLLIPKDKSIWDIWERNLMKYEEAFTDERNQPGKQQERAGLDEIFEWYKHSKEIIEKFKKFEPGEIGFSTITVTELHYGIAKSKHQKRNQLRLGEFLAPLEILDYDEAAAGAYGDIRFQLEKRGQPIGPLDLLIAAQAASRELILVTNNDEEFSRIREVRVENWTK
jgi:predicted nucleic acid-binding protein/virulence-associated protein VagC